MTSFFKKYFTHFILVLIFFIGIYFIRFHKSEDSQSFHVSVPTVHSINQPNSFAKLVKKVQPAVVNISTNKEIVKRQFNPWHPFYKPRYSKEKRRNSLGTGFIINERGDIITNNHVVEGADEILVNLDDGRELDAKVIGRDARLDLAVIRINKKGTYPYAILADSDSLNVGDWVIAIGNPFGLGHTVTSGIVSAKARYLGAGPYDDFIQTDASINPGNSGGPLFNIHGEVVGINTAIIESGQGLGFAIPINIAKEVVPQLITDGRVSRGWLGVAIRDLSREESKKLGYDKLKGAFVSEVIPGSPAEKAGIKNGDFIIKFNGQEVDNSQNFPSLVARLKPGESAKVLFMSGGEKYERSVTLGSLDGPKRGGQTEILGMNVRDLSPAENRRVSHGILVLKTKEGGIADSIGIRAGDLILEINGKEIQSLSEFTQIINSLPKRAVIKLAIGRQGYMYYFAFRKE